MAPTGSMADRKPRGELAELSVSLQNLCTTGKRSDKELKTAKRDVFKKVINYMTLGMDMSALFPMMTSCANLSSDDLVLKKMLYLYLTHYASHAPDLALLTINQLQKDSHDTDPLVRGLALRSLCSLRVPNFLEYVVSLTGQIDGVDPVPVDGRVGGDLQRPCTQGGPSQNEHNA